MRRIFASAVRGLDFKVLQQSKGETHKASTAGLESVYMSGQVFLHPKDKLRATPGGVEAL